MSGGEQLTCQHRDGGQAPLLGSVASARTRSIQPVSRDGFPHNLRAGPRVASLHIERGLSAGSLPVSTVILLASLAHFEHAMMLARRLLCPEQRGREMQVAIESMVGLQRVATPTQQRYKSSR
jgi:hypothetical protein